MTQLRTTPANTAAAQRALAHLGLSHLEVIPTGASEGQERDEELIDIYTTRAVVEELAARQAAQHLSDADVDSLALLADSLERARRQGRTDEFARLSKAFHLTIYRASKRRHLLRVIEELWDTSERHTLSAWQMASPEAEEGMYTIRSMLAACRLRDANALALMVRYRIHRAATALALLGGGADSAPPPSQTVLKAAPRGE